MTYNKLFRFAGWSALLSALFIVAAVVSFPLGAGMVGGILEILALLLTAFVFYALYIAHRAQSAGLALIGLVLLFLALAADAISMNQYGNTFLSNLWYFLFSLPFLIFGFLAYRRNGMPRGLAIVTLLTGVALFISGVTGFLGSQALAETISSVGFLIMLVWLVWLWRYFWSGKMAAT